MTIKILETARVIPLPHSRHPYGINFKILHCQVIALTRVSENLTSVLSFLGQVQVLTVSSRSEVTDLEIKVTENRTHPRFLVDATMVSILKSYTTVFFSYHIHNTLGKLDL